MKRILTPLLLMVSGFMIAQSELPTIDIAFNGLSAKVTIPANIPDVTCSSGTSSNVVISSNTTSQEYRYRVKGTTGNGSLTITSNGYKLTVELAGTNITSTNGSAININSSKRAAVVLTNGTNNTLKDIAGGAQKAAFYCAGHPEFQGGGTLNVTGNTKHAISAKEYLELKSDVGVINILGAVSDGIHCGRGKVNNANNYFEMNGGTVNISGVGSDCIDSDDYGCMKIKGGTLNLTVSTIGGAGLKCDSIFTMKDGQVNINLTAQDAEGIRCNHTANFKGGDIAINNSGTGSKGIKLKKEISGTVLNGGNANFSGTDVDIILTGATLTSDGSRCMGISVDTDMNLSAGDITLLRNGNQVKSHNIKGQLAISDGGRMILSGNHYAPNATGQHNMSLYAKAKVFEQVISDYANLHVGAFVGTQCRGNADIIMVRDGYTYAYLPINGTNGNNISLRLYDASEGAEIASRETISLQDLKTIGAPSSPTFYNFGMKGDVNCDGRVSIGDLTHLTRILNGGSATSYATKAADMNNDVNVTRTDVAPLVNALKSK